MDSKNPHYNYKIFHHNHNKYFAYQNKRGKYIRVSPRSGQPSIELAKADAKNHFNDSEYAWRGIDPEIVPLQELS